MGRSAILGEQRNNDFVDVACGRGEMADSTYAITKTGLLCEFNNRRLLDKWVELRVSRSARDDRVSSFSLFRVHLVDGDVERELCLSDEQCQLYGGRRQVHLYRLRRRNR